MTHRGETNSKYIDGKCLREQLEQQCEPYSWIEKEQEAKLQTEKQIQNEIMKSDERGNKSSGWHLEVIWKHKITCDEEIKTGTAGKKC